MNQTPYDELLNTLHAMGYDETFQLTQPHASIRSPRWLPTERPHTPARGSDPYLQALTQLVNRLR